MQAVLFPVNSRTLKRKFLKSQEILLEIFRNNVLSQINLCFLNFNISLKENLYPNIHYVELKRMTNISLKSQRNSEIRYRRSREVKKKMTPYYNEKMFVQYYSDPITICLICQILFVWIQYYK